MTSKATKWHSQARFDAILFDLDGTLIDSAPDLAHAANCMRVARGLRPYAASRYRSFAGSGARGMLSVAFGVHPRSPCYQALKTECLDLYEACMFQKTAVFQGVGDMLGTLSTLGIPWGIVTNKAERFCAPLVHALADLRGCSALVGGDTTGHTKPHPAPVLEACKRLGVPPSRTLYAGDDQRDIQAGRAAGTATAACNWGYVGVAGDAHLWQADCLVQTPSELLAHILELE